MSREPLTFAVMVAMERHQCGCAPAPRPWPKWRAGPIPREIDLVGGITQRGFLVGVERTYTNGHYAVMIRPLSTEWGLIEHAMIQQVSGAPVRNWRDMQRIKNEIFGEARTAIEVFPPDDEVVDESPLMHLWVLPRGMTLPFSLMDAYRKAEAKG